MRSLTASFASYLSDAGAGPQQSDGTGNLLPVGKFTVPLTLSALVLQRGGTAPAIAGGTALFIAGLPHGAFSNDRSLLLSESGYTGRYLAAGALVAGVFLAVPVITLGSFLALSANHFVREPSGGRALRRVAPAGLLTGGSALVRPGQTAEVFAALCGTAIPNAMIAALAAAGTVGHGAALVCLSRQPRDASLWVIVAAPALFHPVLATGMIFMLGHAAPVTAAIMRENGWGRRHGRLLASASALLSAVAVQAVAPRLRLLPLLAAGALAIIVPHLLPSRWLRRSASQARHNAQAATSPAT